ncbi:MAG: dTDP-4-dehydrorhamnose 3,5-epimerase [Nitrospirales bacterium]|nr:dTDP-4-dehydrorhamnose 3,5-epimerase [Nitrospirales bacterium]
MKFIGTELPGVIIVNPEVHRDARGCFLETYHTQKYGEGGIKATFVQDNSSHSFRGILRGLHAQLLRPQGKLIRVSHGEIFDVAVDIRRGSPTFARWVGVNLSGENFQQIYIPPGFAHGFCVLSDVAKLEYKCTDFYEPKGEVSVRWDDPTVNIRWPIDTPILSQKDLAGQFLQDLLERLPQFEGTDS